MSHDNGSAAQPDRVVKDPYAQKVYGKFAARPIFSRLIDAGLFAAGKAQGE